MTDDQIKPYDYHASTSLGVCALAIVLAVISVALRFYTRVFTRAGLKADDWLILLAVAVMLLVAGLLLWAIIGNRINTIGTWIVQMIQPDYVYTSDDVFFLKIAFVTSVLYFTISATTKLGILFMYYRIFAVDTTFRYSIFITGGLVISWWIGCTIVVLDKCRPREWGWSNGLEDLRYCFDYNVFWVASGTSEVLLDVLILTLPIAVVVRMRLSLQQKLVVSGVFLLGGFVIITGVLRVALGSSAPAYSNTEIWTSVHAGISIVCASLPILKPLGNRVSRSRFMIKLSSVLSLRRRGECLEPSPNRITMFDSCRRESRYGNKRNNRIRLSYLSTLGGNPIHESSYLPRMAYLGDVKSERS
ncbi:hypothetical protein F4804DRAFT_348769 [Jackrogersella minutella]|nr:hypothetical protein F4804DRAFT_348769 [Jackrogersella minutella]